MGLEYDTNKFKVGDGNTAWNSRGYGGLEGPTGPTGAASTVAGPTGPAGYIGQDGATGPTGYIGTDGATGPTGPAGPASAAGADQYPLVAQSGDDEFDSNTLNAAWTTVNTPSYSTSLSYLVMPLAAPDNGIVPKLLIQSTPSGTWCFRSHLGGKVYEANFCYNGLVVANSNKYLCFVRSYDTANRFQVVRMTGNALTSSGYILAFPNAVEFYGHYFAEVEFNGTFVFYRLSVDGADNTFKTVYTENMSYFLGGTPTHVGYVIGANMSSTPSTFFHVLSSHWWRRRIGYTPSADPSNSYPLTVDPQVRYSFLPDNFTSGATSINNVGIQTSIGAATVSYQSYTSTTPSFITMNGGTYRMQVPSNMSANTIVMVFRLKGWASNTYFVDFRSGNSGYMLPGTTTVGGTYFWNVVNTGSLGSLNYTTMSTSQWSHLVFRNASAYAGALTFFQYYAGTSGNLNIDVAELMFFSSQLTDAQIKDNYNYFSSRFGWVAIA
jgi:hypothetical protein